MKSTNFKPLDLAKLREAVTERRFLFVCTPEEFCHTYGYVPEKLAKEASELVVYCKDGFIRPR